MNITKVCPNCGQVFSTEDEFQTICDFCERHYDKLATIEKVASEHVVDGGTWWRLQHNRDEKSRKNKR